MKNFKLIFHLILLTFIVVSCSTKSLPPLSQLKEDLKNYQLPKLPQAGKAIIYVIRPSPAALLVKFDVFVKNTEAENKVGYTRPEQYIYFEVDPGIVKIISVAENNAELEIEVEPDKVYFIAQNVELGVLLARNSINTLSEIEGKYRVKTTEVGTLK